MQALAFISSGTRLKCACIMQHTRDLSPEQIVIRTRLLMSTSVRRVRVYFTAFLALCNLVSSLASKHFWFSSQFCMKSTTA
jgi:hypothetical protein